MLNGRTILVVEDEYLIADDLATAFRAERADVLGPAESLPAAMRLIDAGARPDVAILDINMRGVDVYPLADRLIADGVPILFATGYDAIVLPARYDHLPRLQKPFEKARMVEIVNGLIGQA